MIVCIEKPADVGSPGLFYIPLSAPQPATAEEFSTETVYLLNALGHIQDAIHNNFGSYAAKAFRCFAASTTRLSGSFEAFDQMFRQVHEPKEPEFEGQYVESYHKHAFKVCLRRRGVLWQMIMELRLVPPSKNQKFGNEDIEWESDVLVEHLDFVREHWHFKPVDTDRLRQRVVDEMAACNRQRINGNNHELIENRPESSADSADNSKNIPPKHPENDNVADLCKMLAREHGKGKSYLQITREFVAQAPGCGLNAKTLLRQADRFPHLWKSDDS